MSEIPNGTRTRNGGLPRQFAGVDQLAALSGRAGPLNWYWQVGNRPGVVYSGPAGNYVPPTDQGYVDFTASGRAATVIAVDGELADALTKMGLEGPQVIGVAPTDWGEVSDADLIVAVQAAGVRISSTAAPDLDGHYPLHGDALGLLNSSAIYVNAYDALPGDLPLVWQVYDDQVTIADVTQFAALYKALQDYLALWSAFVFNGGDMPAWGSVTIA